MGELYNHIATLGKARGYANMTALCRAAGVPRSTMSELKAGRSRDLSKPNAQKFADLLGLTLEEIYGTARPERTERPERTISDDELMFALWGDTDEVTEGDLADVRRYAAFLRERKKRT